jgi:uracil-DNA glycosylase
MTAPRRSERLAQIEAHVRALSACARCPQMGKPVVTGRPVVSPIVFVGQAPGDKEPIMGKPFAWTAGRNLFKWFGSLGVDEETFRDNVYMAAVCRCFPGKNPKGGDRVPSDEEIANCAPWLERELEICRPKLAIARFLEEAPLVETIGKKHTWKHEGRAIDLIPLPHPSGASTWYHVEPGKTLTKKALALIGKHPAWGKIRGDAR